MIHSNDEESYYIAGKMTNEPQFGIPVFNKAAANLRAQGLVIVSPAELDDPELRKRCLASSDGKVDGHGPSWGTLLGRDIQIVADEVTGVIVLPNWNKSRGARLETFVAFLCGKPIHHYPSLKRVTKKTLIRAWLGPLYDAKST